MALVTVAVMTVLVVIVCDLIFAVYNQLFGLRMTNYLTVTVIFDI